MNETEVTALDVARAAGVSRSTVSRAFSPAAPVNRETRRRVLRAAEALGYQPNALAQALISRRSSIVGIVMGELENPFHSLVHQVITQHLQAAGLIPVTAQLGPDMSIDKIIAMFRQYQVAAVLLTSMNVTHEMVEVFRGSGLKVCLFNRMDEDRVGASICADLEQGGAAAAAHLIERGYRRLAVATGPRGHWTSGARRRGHLKGIARAGLAPVVEHPGGYRYEDGRSAAGALMCGPRKSRPDAILCPNDLFAFGLMDALRLEHNIKIPEDLAAVGFDDIPMGTWQSYRLTTVRLPVESLSERAVDVLNRILATGEQAHETIWVPCSLSVRSTT